MNEKMKTGKLVGAKQLLEQLFESKSRPSLRWLRSKTKEAVIPSVRLGRLVFFDVEAVRRSMAQPPRAGSEQQ